MDTNNVVGIKEKGSPMFDHIDDPQLRERTLAAQQYLRDKYNQLGTWKKVARQVKGFGEAAFVSFSSGSYNANPANIVTAIERARSLEDERASTVFLPSFVETSISRRIRRAVRQTRARGMLGIIAGQSGVGKSKTIESIVAEDKTITRIRCNPTFAMRLWPVLALVKDRLGHGGERTASPAVCYELIRQALSTSGKTLLFDEAQFLSRQALDTFRTLSEDAEAPIVFCGNESIHEAAFFSGNNPAAFVQFTSRCSVNELLRRTDITRGDVDLIAGQRLDEEVLEETRDELIVEARSEGGFRRLQTVIQRSHEKARGGSISAAQVFDAIAETAKTRGAR